MSAAINKKKARRQGHSIWAITNTQGSRPRQREKSMTMSWKIRKLNGFLTKVQCISAHYMYGFCTIFWKFSEFHMIFRKLLNPGVHTIFYQKAFWSPLSETFSVSFSRKTLKHNRLTSGELLSNDRRAIDFVSSSPLFSEASFSLI